MFPQPGAVFAQPGAVFQNLPSGAPTQGAALFNGFRVVIAHHPKDGAWRDRLATHLGHLTQSGKVDFWDVTRIPPGANQSQAITFALTNAHLIIALVSADFRDSEIARAVAHRAQTNIPVIPIRVAPCVLTNTWLDGIQFLPTHNKPLGKGPSADAEQDLADIAAIIAAHLNAQATTTTIRIG